MTINDNSTKSINAAIIDLQNQIKQLQHKIDILSKNQLKEDDIEFPGKVEYADEAGKAKEADNAKTADTAKYASETENAVHAGYADIATKATQDGSGNVITDTYATKTALSSGLAGKSDTGHTHDYLPLSGGAMTGNIKYKGSKNTYDAIKFIDNTKDNRGNGISIGADGLTIIGGGESSNTIAAQQTSGGDEKMIIANDQEIDFYTNTQNGFSSAKHITMNTDGTITAAGFNGTATKAAQDASGNVIIDTYATKTELTSGLSGKANTSHNHSAADITSVNLSKTLDTVNGDKLQIGNGTAQNVTNAKHAATADAFSTAYTSYITPAQAAAMEGGTTIWPLRYDKDYLQTVTVTWDDYSSHTFPAGAAGMFFPRYCSNGGTLILINFTSDRMLYNVWIESNRWSG